jgi:hypothetical protein
MKFLREPLVHFLLLGAAIFVIYGLVSGDRGGKANHIIVSQGKIANLVATFTRIWQRPPADRELEGLIQDYIREEVLYREALALGLDRDDTIIRRRLRQKMEFVSEDFAARAEPSDDELRAYLRTYPEVFAIEPRFTFRQVYLDPQRRGANLARDVARLLDELQQADENWVVAFVFGRCTASALPVDFRSRAYHKSNSRWPCPHSSSASNLGSSGL